MYYHVDYSMLKIVDNSENGGDESHVVGDDIDICSPCYDHHYHHYHPPHRRHIASRWH